MTLDMRRMQGALVAFLPERIGKLQVRHAAERQARPAATDGARWSGESGKPLDAVFPVEIKLATATSRRRSTACWGAIWPAEIDLPQSRKARQSPVEVRESISGRPAGVRRAAQRADRRPAWN